MDEIKMSLPLFLLAAAISFIKQTFFITLAVMAVMAMAGIIDLSFLIWGAVLAMEAVVGAALGLIVYVAAGKSDESSV